jgi:hypothetical protein
MKAAGQVMKGIGSNRLDRFIPEKSNSKNIGRMGSLVYL